MSIGPASAIQCGSVLLAPVFLEQCENAHPWDAQLSNIRMRKYPP